MVEPVFQVYFHEDRREWRIYGYGRDICGAINEAVARETAVLMNAAQEHYR